MRQGLTHEYFREIIDGPLPLRIEFALCQDVVQDGEQVWCLANEICEGIKSNSLKLIEIDRDAAVEELIHLRVV